MPKELVAQLKLNWNKVASSSHSECPVAATLVANLGAMRVSDRGDLANWIVPCKMFKGWAGDGPAGIKRVVS